MTKKELVKALAAKQGITQTTAEAHLTALMEIIKEELSAGNEVNLSRDFGTFKPVTRKGVIPATIPAKEYESKSVKFSISDSFKRALN